MDRRTDRQTENTICRAAWSQLKRCDGRTDGKYHSLSCFVAAKNTSSFMQIHLKMCVKYQNKWTRMTKFAEVFFWHSMFKCIAASSLRYQNRSFSNRHQVDNLLVKNTNTNGSFKNLFPSTIGELTRKTDYVILTTVCACELINVYMIYSIQFT